MSELEDINTLEQAAAYLKIEPTKLRRLVHQRTIAFLKQGHTLTFPRAALQAYVQTNTTNLPTPPPNPWGLTPGALRTVYKA
ncbi:helix-turn-helix domain-containing protein [Cryobacterium cryoconiti]|uniref:DNA-binding protein n=1 Tax=Cryobacterium cryoconiti TaxID=1259239 RepID=A0A4Y8JUS7_9MICO|nr:helix-turn-helix domain-containing protein [Cryobacterium cryoconiti]TFD27999.1 DNA-binding protein [Cryobacterium cryoconiti]